jgi:hypothetical protein
MKTVMGQREAALQIVQKEIPKTAVVLSSSLVILPKNTQKQIQQQVQINKQEVKNILSQKNITKQISETKTRQETVSLTRTQQLNRLNQLQQLQFKQLKKQQKYKQVQIIPLITTPKVPIYSPFRLINEDKNNKSRYGKRRLKKKRKIEVYPTAYEQLTRPITRKSRPKIKLTGLTEVFRFR